MLFRRLLALLPAAAHALALLLMALAVLLPVALWLGGALFPQDQLRWAIAYSIRAPNDEELWNSGRFLDGGEVFLSNEGNAPSREVRIRFALAPKDTDELVLGSLAPLDEVMINLYGFSPYGGMTVLEDGQPVDGDFLDPSEFDDPEAWFPTGPSMVARS